ncbi:OmpA family protein [Loktanella agnita]|uniref:OmpA family protein n=1 Tax=Loktanella agnita TaxID=287097 RepID=UPI0039871C80
MPRAPDAMEPEEVPPTDAVSPPLHLWRRHAVTVHPSSVVGEQDRSAWAVPYTDLTMLLMVFFVIMLSQAGQQIGRAESTVRDRTDYSYLFAATSGSERPARSTLLLGGQGIMNGQNGLLPGGDSLVAQAGSTVSRNQVEDSNDRIAADQDNFAVEWARRVRELENTAAAFLADSVSDDQVTLVTNARGIELRMAEDVLFASGSDTLQNSGEALISSLAPLLRRIDGDIEISGHTDNIPINTLRFPSNWALSSARSIAVVRLLRDLGVPERDMQAVGHGDNRPIASNSTASGRAANRRVTIDITPRPDAQPDNPSPP